MEDIRLTCPFDPSHRINESRMQFHLTKCIKNQIMVGKSVCPYNPLHIYDVNEILHHCKHCPNNATVQRQIYTQEDKKCFANIITPEEAARQLAQILPNDDSWERRHAIQGPGYDPNVDIEKKLVYRSLNVESKSKREHFRALERRRFAELERDKKNEEEDEEPLPPQSLRRPRNESVVLQIENTTRKPQLIPKAKKFINEITNGDVREVDKFDKPQTYDDSNLDSTLLEQLKKSLIIADGNEAVAVFQELETLEEAKKNNEEQKKKNQEQLTEIKEREAQIRELEKQMELKERSIEIKNKIIEDREKELVKLLVQKAIQSGSKISTDESNRSDDSDDSNSSKNPLLMDKSDKENKLSAGKKNADSPSKVTRSNPKCAATFGSSSPLVLKSSSSALPQAPGVNRNGNGARSCGRGIVHAWNQNNQLKIGERIAPENKEEET